MERPTASSDSNDEEPIAMEAGAIDDLDAIL